IEGAPALSHVSFHTPLKGGIAIGASAYNDQEGLINTTAIKGSVSYLLAIDRKHYLRVGMSLGGGTKSINTDGFDSPADPAFSNLSESSSFTLGQFGATYHFGHFNVGFALPNLVGYEIVSDENFSRVKVDPFDEALLKANYRGHINDDIAFEPHLLYRYNQDLPNQFELAVITHLKHIVWVGASYRQDAGIVALFGTKVKEKIGIGFAYDIGNSNFNDLLGPTFELHIGYHLGTKKEHAEHVSSFIKSHRLTAEQRLEKERKKQLALEKQEEKDNANLREKLAESRKDRLEKNGSEDAPSTSQEKEASNPEAEGNDENNTEITKAAESEKPADTKESKDNITETEKARNESKAKVNDINKLIEQQRRKAKENNTQQNEPEAVKREESPKTKSSSSQDSKNQLPDNVDSNGKVTSSNDPQNNNQEVTPIEKPVTTNKPEVEDNRTIAELAKSDDPKVVTGGDHMLELSNGHYIVAGAFQVFDHAEDFSDELFEKGYRDVIVGYISETELYYTVIFQSKNLDNAKKRRNALKDQNGLQEIWLLTVE
ncbi:MAG: PorP/SprF family type IX secretion system membrane protein, partial [Bacteroidota bacterium]